MKAQRRAHSNSFPILAGKSLGGGGGQRPPAKLTSTTTAPLRNPSVMATPPEITHLFSELALTLTRAEPVEEGEDGCHSSLDLSISKMNRSLNLGESSRVRVRVLDTALSLMCFRAPQVFYSEIEYLVKTIVGVLSSSVKCNVSRFEKGEVLRFGSPFSPRDCMELVEFVSDAIPKLESHGISSNLVLRAVVRVAVSSSCFRCFDPSRHICRLKAVDGKGLAISKQLFRHLTGEFTLDNNQIPLRLLFWYLDPLTLKHDISKILQDTMKRPFLSLSQEFYERMDWRSILVCLVLSPIMFINARALLHDWFLLTGLGSILELLVELVFLVLDVISRPTWWGISMDLGSRLPFSNAYFPYNNHLFRIFVGPLSSESFLQLTRETSELDSPREKQFGPTIKQSALKVALIDQKSIWALAISFPVWFYFASFLLFSDCCFKENFEVECTLGATSTQHAERLPPVAAAAAARYIAWIVSPDNKFRQDILSDNLMKMSNCRCLKEINSSVSGKGTVSHKKLKKTKILENEEGFAVRNESGCPVIGLWLQEFQKQVEYGNGSNRNSILLRRIPLAMLIGAPTYTNEDGWELLFHYAVTGRMIHSVASKKSSRKQVKQSSRLQDLIMGSNKYTEKEAIAGASLVFTLTDTVARMSASLCDTEESVLDLISQVKSRAARYFFMCIKRLTEPDIPEDRLPVLVDLHCRLERWSHQWQGDLQHQEDLADTMKALSNRISSI